MYTFACRILCAKALYTVSLSQRAGSIPCWGTKKKQKLFCERCMQTILSLSKKTCHLLRVTQDKDDAVSTEKHFTDESVLVHRLCLRLTLWYLGPHLSHILQHHVHVPVKGLYSSEHFPIVSAVHQHLAVVPAALLQHAQGANIEVIFFRSRGFAVHGKFIIKFAHTKKNA